MIGFAEAFGLTHRQLSGIFLEITHGGMKNCHGRLFYYDLSLSISFLIQFHVVVENMIFQIAVQWSYMFQ